MPYLFTVIAVVVVVNFFLLFRSRKRKSNVGKKATDERIATVKRHEDLVRKLDFEQADAIRRVELQNKTFEMYEQVRRQVEAEEQENEVIDNK